MPNTFQEVSDYLSQFRLEDLIVASSVFSTMEYHDNFPDGDCYYAPMMNIVKSIMFTKAVLYSDSIYNNGERFLPEELPWVLNNLSDAADNEEIIDNDELNDNEKLDQIILSMFSSQLWYNRDITKERIPLLYSLYFELPYNHREELQNKHKSHFVDIPEFIRENLGIRLDKYLITSIFLAYILPNEAYNRFFIPNPQVRAFINSLQPDDERHLSIRQQLIFEQTSRLESLSPWLTFSSSPVSFSKYPLLEIMEFLNEEEFESYINLTSRDIFELRELNNEDAHQLGHISQRLTPFERYPILKLDKPCYVIPNLRFFEISITELIRFALQQSFKNNEFHEVMGSVQELLINDLLSQLVNDELFLIPERSYVKNNSEYLGPDLIVIDKGRPILIESKAKQLLLNTRLNPDGQPLSDNLKSVVDAILELEKNKLDDYYNESVYSDVQHDIINEVDCEPIFVGIIAEGVITMQEQVTKIKNSNAEHPLNSVQHPHVFLDIYHLYKVIEICKTNSLSLYDCLYKYWEVGNIIEPKKYSADSFDGLKYNPMDSYSKSKMDSLIHNLYNT